MFQHCKDRFLQNKNDQMKVIQVFNHPVETESTSQYLHLIKNCHGMHLKHEFPNYHFLG